MSALLVPSSSSPVRRARNQGLALGTITPETYRAFLASPEGRALGPGFLQCPSWADVKEGWQSLLIGWGPDPDAGALTGAALVLLRQFPGTRKYFAYLPEGPVADWGDPDVDAWLDPLLDHLRRAGAFAVRIGPSPAYRRWDAARLKPLAGPGRSIGDVLASEVDPLGSAVADRLRVRGWRRCGGDGTGQGGDAQPRHVFQVPLAGRTPDDLWAGLNQEWRRNVRRARKEGVEVVVGSAADLPEFSRLLTLTERRDGFRLGRSLAYYERQYAALNAEEPGRMKLYLARHRGDPGRPHDDHRGPPDLVPDRRVGRPPPRGPALERPSVADAAGRPRDRGGRLRHARGTLHSRSGRTCVRIAAVEARHRWSGRRDIGGMGGAVGGSANHALHRAFQAYLNRR